jgi:hypothetical protein
VLRQRLEQGEVVQQRAALPPEGEEGAFARRTRTQIMRLEMGELGLEGPALQVGHGRIIDQFGSTD